MENRETNGSSDEQEARNEGQGVVVVPERGPAPRKSGLAERIKKKIEELVRSDPNTYPLF
jgi:hypothetical protein